MNFADQNGDSSDEELERADTGDLPPDKSAQFSDSPEFLRKLKNAQTGLQLLVLLDELINSGDVNGRTPTFTRLHKFMKSKNLLTTALTEKKRSFSQYNKTEVPIFRNIVGQVHETAFFEALKSAIPPPKTVIPAKFASVGTEDGKMSGAGDHSRGCVINRVALMALVVAHPSGQLIALDYNQPIINRTSVMSGGGIANFNQSFGIRFIELAKTLVDNNEIVNTFGSMIGDVPKADGFFELDNVRPELGVFPSGDVFLTLMKEQKTATDTLRHNLHQSGRNESLHILDKTALSFCSNSANKTTNLATFFCYLAWKDVGAFMSNALADDVGEHGGFSQADFLDNPVDMTEPPQSPSAEEQKTPHAIRKERERESEAKRTKLLVEAALGAASPSQPPIGSSQEKRNREDEMIASDLDMNDAIIKEKRAKIELIATQKKGERITQIENTLKAHINMQILSEEEVAILKDEYRTLMLA